jgi:hypothetical protein
MSVAGHGLAWPDVCGCWLPVWLPGFVSAANLQQARAPTPETRYCPRSDALRGPYSKRTGLAPDRWGVAGGRPGGSLTSAAGRLSLACRLAQRASGGRTSRPPHCCFAGVAFSNRSLAAGTPGMG